MAVNKFRIHFLYLSEKRLSIKACIFSSKQMAFVYLAFFDDGTAFPYLPVLPCDFLFGADTLSCLVKEHAAGSNLHIRFGEQFPLAENQMDMIIRLALVMVEGGHAGGNPTDGENRTAQKPFPLRGALSPELLQRSKGKRAHLL